MPIPALAAGALISGASSLASSLITNEGNRKSQKRADKYNLAQWNRQNAYNDPSAQMERLRKAGLNPNLIYGSSTAGATGQASPAPLSKAAPYKIDNPLGQIQTVANLQARGEATNNLKTQNTVQAQQAINLAAQTAKTGIETDRGKVGLALDKRLLNTSAEAAEMNLRKLESETIGQEIETSFKGLTLQNRVKDIYYRTQNAKATLQGQTLENQLKALQRDLKQLGIENNDPWYFRIFGRHLDLINETVNKSKKKFKK